jgi:HK97 family phage major capsid protein/HK97 family phage prohead protease
MAFPKTLAPQHRSLSLRADAPPQVDLAARTVRFPFSSETPVDMWYGTEILSHTPGAMRTGQRQESMPALFNHCRDDLLGIVESVEIGPDARGYATVRFGKDERGDWAMQQVNDGILVNVSFYYRVFKFIEDVEEEIYTATDWEPYEVSFVTIPADATVGVGRAASTESENPVIVETRARADPPPNQQKTVVKPPAPENRQAANQTPSTEGVVFLGERKMGVETNAGGEQKTADQILAEERKRVAEIDAMCRTHNVAAEMRDGLIKNGASIEQAKGAVLDLQLTRSAKPVASLTESGHAPDLSEAEKSRYSMIRAINAVINRDWRNAGFEQEVSAEIGKRMGKETAGFYMPTNLPFGKRAAYAAGATATGGAMVATNLLADAFIEVLRNRARVLQLGATVLSGLVGNVAIPRQTGASSTYWVTEAGALTESEASFDQVSLSFKSIGTYGAVSRQMLLQSTPDIEMIVRNDLIKQLALGIDLAALSGSGAGGQPTGIANTSGIGSVIGGTNGAQLTIDNLIDLETAVAAANADVDGMAYLGNAKTVGWLKKQKSTTGSYLWTDSPNGQRSSTPGQINGYDFARSNQARSTLTKGTSTSVCSEVFFGNWAELIIGEWGVLEILPNPYDATLFKQGGVLLRAMQSLDIGVRHAASFSTISDALTN